MSHTTSPTRAQNGRRAAPPGWERPGRALGRSSKRCGDDLEKAAAWGISHRRPVYLGEFGAYGKADMDSRARWTAFVARTAEEKGLSWAYWEFCAGFGVYDPTAGEWREPLLRALIPK